MGNNNNNNNNGNDNKKYPVETYTGPTKKILSSVETTTQDNTTGEVITSTREVHTSVPQTPDFVMLFTQDMGFLADITDGAGKLLFGLLKYVDRGNEIFIGKNRKETIAKMVGISVGSMSRMLKQLVDKEVLFRTGHSVYALNPNYFGRGKWKDIYKMRISMVYDFEKETRSVVMDSIEYNNDEEHLQGIESDILNSLNNSNETQNQMKLNINKTNEDDKKDIKRLKLSKILGEAAVKTMSAEKVEMTLKLMDIN